MRSKHTMKEIRHTVLAGTLLCVVAVSDLRADNIRQWSTNCGTWSATESQGNTPQTITGGTIDLPAGFSQNYNIALNNQGCTGPAGPAGPPGPVGPAGPTGPQGPAGATGATGPQGEPGPAGPAGPQGPQGVAGQDGQDGKDGKDGKNGKDGKDFDMDESLALSAALSLPVWLQQNENFSVSGGVGFSDGGETALGATGIVRLDGNVSAFGGAAFATEGSAWAGKAGLRLGW